MNGETQSTEQSSMTNGLFGRSVTRCEQEQATEEGGFTNDELNQTPKSMKQRIRMRRERRIGLKENKEEVDHKRHSQNMKVMKGVHIEMKQTNAIIQDVVDHETYMAETQKIYMALQFVPKDSERYQNL